MVAGLEGKGYTFLEASVQMVPQNYVKLTSEEDIKNMEKLLEFLEDNDDVQNVYHNWSRTNRNFSSNKTAHIAKSKKIHNLFCVSVGELWNLSFLL